MCFSLFPPPPLLCPSLAHIFSYFLLFLPDTSQDVTPWLTYWPVYLEFILKSSMTWHKEPPTSSFAMHLNPLIISSPLFVIIYKINSQIDFWQVACSSMSSHLSGRGIIRKNLIFLPFEHCTNLPKQHLKMSSFAPFSSIDPFEIWPNANN